MDIFCLGHCHRLEFGMISKIISMKVLHLMELDLSEEYILNLKCPQQFILATIADLSELAVLDEPNAYNALDLSSNASLFIVFCLFRKQ